jgi:hypothetical protein
MKHKSINMKKTITLLAFLIMAIVTVGVFWIVGHQDPIVYSILYIWFLLPIVCFFDSLLIGKNHYYGKFNWLLPILYGILYTATIYLTFPLANNIAFQKLNAPNINTLFVGIAISFLGIAIGNVIYIRKKHLDQRD